MKRPPIDLPTGIDRLEGMARGEPAAFPRGPRGSAAQIARWRQAVFEHAVWDSFEAAGLSVRRLGHHTPGKAVPDAVAHFPHHTGFFLIVDAKMSANPYQLPRADRRALAEYAQSWSRRLHRGGVDTFERIYIVLVSSDFPTSLGSEIAEIKRARSNPLLTDVLLVPAQVLAEIVRARLRDARVGSSFYEELLQECPNLVTVPRIAEIKREAVANEAYLSGT